MNAALAMANVQPVMKCSCGCAVRKDLVHDLIALRSPGAALHVRVCNTIDQTWPMCLPSVLLTLNHTPDNKQHKTGRVPTTMTQDMTPHSCLTHLSAC